MKMRQLCLTMLCMVSMLLWSLPTNATENSTNSTSTTSFEETGHPNAPLLVTCPPAGPLFLTSCDVTVLDPPTSDCTINSLSWSLIVFPSMPTGTTPTDPNGNYQPGTYILEWTVDDCDGITICPVEFTIFDQTSPVFTCPLFLFVDCPSDIPTPFTDINEFLAGGGLASDDCTETTNLILVSSTDTPTPDPNDCPESIIRTYNFEDEAGNPGGCIQNIIVQDNIFPTFTVPADITIVTDPNPTNNCFYDSSVAATGDVTDEDENCTGSIGEAVFTDLDNINGCTPGSGSNVHGTITRTWTLTDGCNNTTTQIQTITIIDDTAPTFTAPADITISSDPDPANGCSFDSDPSNTGDVTNELDNCSTNFEATFTDMIMENTPCTGSSIVTRTWSLVDDCGNAAPDQIQTITVTDDTPPTFTAPADITIQADFLCNFDSDVSITGDVTDEMDNCDATVDATFVDNIMVGVPCVGGRIISRTWSLMDDCGNMAPDQVQTITVEDVLPPTFTAPADMTVFTDGTCMYDASIAVTGDVTDEDDNCTTNGLDATFSDSVSADDPCTGAAVITRTWSLQDDCGNMAQDQIQTITVTDNTPPTFTAPADTTISSDDMCMYDDSVANTGDVTDEMDNCTTALDATFTDSVSADDPCTGSAVITRTWSLEDDCGNMAADQVQTITVVDDTPPTFTAPADITITCIEDHTDLTLTGDVTDEMDNCSMGIEAFSTDVIIPGNCDGEFSVERTWSLMDNCGNMAAEQVQTITVEDNIDPVVTCQNITVDTDPGVCEAFVTVPPPGVTEACSSFTVVNDYNGTDDASDTYPEGSTDVIWTVTDDCGNVGTCMFTVTVVDNEDPVVVGDNNICVALGGAGTAQLMTDDILISATDNCMVDMVQIRRLEANGGPCNVVDNDVFGDTVEFCCADAGETVMVALRATDTNGNTAEVMVAIPVKDNIAPTITCPSDVTINCEFPLDVNDFSNLGVITLDPDTPGDIIIDGNVVGMDGFADDNCDLHQDSITETFDDSGLVCNQGVLLRTITISDESGNTASCTQSITIMDDDPFDFDDITFPADFDFLDCNNVDTDPSVTGVPTFIQDKCSIIGYSYFDADFQNPNSGCPFFVRTWTVIDWCQYQSNTPGTPGIWEMAQNISVLNSVAPVFDACQDTIICADEVTCNGELSFTMTATDDCTDTEDLQWTYSLDLFGAGNTFINGNVNTIFGTFPQGDHIVTWTVEDRCGNESTCVQNMTIRDCKAPTVVCINGISVGLMPLNGGGASVEIWASDFNQGSFDNCTASVDLIYSFSSDPNDQFVEFDCNDVGQQNVEVWATDEDGNQSFCNTYVNVQDNHDVCPLGGFVRVGGSMMSALGEGIENVEVHLDSDNMSDMYMSSDVGSYHFEDLEMYEDYQIHPTLNVEHMNGVSTLDLVLIQKHLLDIEELDSPYKLIAADINNTGNLSAIDLVELRKLILGVFTEFPNNMSWRFIPETLVFPDPTYPWNYEELIEIQNIDQDEMGLNFIGVKIGDVNDSAIPNDFTTSSESRSGDQVSFLMDDISFSKGERVSIPMKASGFENIVGMQFTLDYDNNKLQYEGVVPAALSVNQSNVAIPNTDSDVITFSWHNVIPQSSDEVLFILEFVALEDGSIHNYFDLTSHVTEAMAFDEDYNQVAVSSRFDQVFERVEVYQNTPNPFTQQTAISIMLPAEDQVQIHVFDNKGTMVFHHNALMKAGANEVLITREDLNNQSGIYYYEVSTSAERITKRMVLMQ